MKSTLREWGEVQVTCYRLGGGSSTMGVDWLSRVQEQDTTFDRHLRRIELTKRTSSNSVSFRFRSRYFWAYRASADSLAMAKRKGLQCGDHDKMG